MFLEGKKPNSAKIVLVNFLAHSLHIGQKYGKKNAYFCKSNKSAVIRVFWHAEFISALKPEPNPTFFEKNANNNNKKKKNYHYFLFFVIFSKSYKQNCLKSVESCFLDGNNQIQPK